MTRPRREDALIAISTRDRPRELRRCLAALRDTEAGVPVLVIDNAPTADESLTVARDAGVDYMRVDEPGLSRARNAAFRQDASIVLFIDDDAVPHAGWVDAILDEFADSSVDVATGRVVPLSLVTDAERIGARLAIAGPQGLERWTLDQSQPAWERIALSGRLGIGANIAFRRTSVSRWGGFDERFGRGAGIDGGEENLAFYRIIEEGGRAVYTPRAVVSHPVPSTLDAAREKYLRGRTTYAAFYLHCLLELPRARRALLRTAWQRPRRAPDASASDHLLAGWRARLRATASGIPLFLRARGELARTKKAGP